MESSTSVYMCFPCYQEFDTLDEVLKHQLTCNAEATEPAPGASGLSSVTFQQTQVTDGDRLVELLSTRCMFLYFHFHLYSGRDTAVRSLGRTYNTLARCRPVANELRVVPQWIKSTDVLDSLLDWKCKKWYLGIPNYKRLCNNYSNLY